MIADDINEALRAEAVRYFRDTPEHPEHSPRFVEGVGDFVSRYLGVEAVARTSITGTPEYMLITSEDEAGATLAFVGVSVPEDVVENPGDVEVHDKVIDKGVPTDFVRSLTSEERIALVLDLRTATQQLELT
jgi:hypothetical protein